MASSSIEPQKDGPHSLTLSSSSSIKITPPNLDQQESIDLNYMLAPPKLWLIGDHITNYVVWSAHVQDQFRRDGLFGFIDGAAWPAQSKTVPYYEEWRESSQRAKEMLLSLINLNIVQIDDHQHKTCRDIWLQLEGWFLPLVSRGVQGAEGVYKAFNAGPNSGEYMKLHKAALSGDRWAAKHIFQSDVGELMRNNVIARPIIGDGSLAAATPVPVYKDGCSVFPQHTMPIYFRRGMLRYLFTTASRIPEYSDTARLGLLISAIDAGHFKDALELLEEAPYLAELKLSNKSALTCLASNSNQLAFGRQSSKSRPNVFPRAVPFMGVGAVLYFIIQLPQRLGSTHALVRSAVLWIVALSASVCCTITLIILNMLYWLPWKFLQTLGFVAKKLKEMPIDNDAFSLLDKLCDTMKEIQCLPEDVFGDTVFLAARLGLHVIIERILLHYPEAAFCRDSDSGQHIIHVAVESRNPQLFDIIYKRFIGDSFTRLPFHITDSHGNNILHLAAKLSPPTILSKFPGSVLEFQHDLKWFKEIEEKLTPHNRLSLNHDGKTPKMIFMEEHMELKDKSEKWMKDTATSCTIIAALISTIMFAAAITVPGGSDQNTGIPMFTRDSTFTLFAIADAISFITSVVSLLMFMEIMMSRYEAVEFIRQLPIRLFIGLGSLFFSIFFMMLSFSIAVYLVFGQPRYWVLISMATLTSYVVLLFSCLQGSLLREMISSTYRPLILRT